MVSGIITDIRSLAAERPLKTPELYKANDNYGHAYVLKKYSGVKLDYQIKGVLEHAAMVYDHVWNLDVIVPLPAIFTFSDYRFSFLRQITNKALFAIGPSIHYADILFSEEELDNLKKQLGKTLMVFLPHSSGSIDVNFNVKKTISVIKNFEKEFENIMVCLGWKEVLKDVDKPYISEGYTCVTAGNVFDFCFLERLKSLILLSSHTMSFDFGTHIGFCIYLNKPHWVIQEVTQKVDVPKPIRNTVSYVKKTPLSTNLTNYILDHFKNPQDFIDDKQKDVVDMMWGTSHIKSPEKMKELFNITEDMYKAKYMPCDRKNPLILCQSFDYAEKEEVKKAKDMIKYIKNMGFSKKWIDLLKSLIAIKEGRLLEAEKVVKKLLKDKGFVGEKARELIECIEGKDGSEISISKELADFYPKPQFFSTGKITLPWRKV